MLIAGGGGRIGQVRRSLGAGAAWACNARTWTALLAPAAPRGAHGVRVKKPCGGQNPARKLTRRPHSGLSCEIRLPAFAAEAAAVAGRPIRLWACLVHVESAAIKVRAIDGGNRSIALCIVCHLNEAEATRLTAVPIHNDIDTINSAVSCKQRTDSLFRSPKAEVSNKNIFHVFYFSFF